ncbi:Ser-Thr-rich glycosyl-phosphatidyl-inositol-anchored membrane family-domain-containing protein, partial [Pyrenochaeta sp. MPI-SDFR-AT-0127]
FQTILSGAALIAAAAALTIDTFPANVVAGETYTVTYSPKDNTPTTFILRQGPSGNLNTIETLTTTATGGSFSWTVKSTYANQPNYALEIRQGDVINYSGQFPLTGGSGSAASSAASSARASASSAAASAASSASAALS